MVKRAVTKPTMTGVVLSDNGVRLVAALGLVSCDGEGVGEVEEEDDEPGPAQVITGFLELALGLAVEFAVDWVPASWLPLPEKPTPLPAPCFMYLRAGSGIAGRPPELSTSQFGLSLAGQSLGPPVELYPPSPFGFGVLLKATFSASKSGRVWTEPPSISTRP